MCIQVGFIYRFDSPRYMSSFLGETPEVFDSISQSHTSISFTRAADNQPFLP